MSICYVYIYGKRGRSYFSLIIWCNFVIRLLGAISLDMQIKNIVGNGLYLHYQKDSSTMLHCRLITCIHKKTFHVRSKECLLVFRLIMTVVVFLFL